MRRYQSSAMIERSFCGRCGSKLFFRFAPLADQVWVTLGTLDEDPGVRAESHIFVASKAAWHEITDGLPRHVEYAPLS